LSMKKRAEKKEKDTKGREGADKKGKWAYLPLKKEAVCTRRSSGDYTISRISRRGNSLSKKGKVGELEKGGGFTSFAKR